MGVSHVAVNMWLLVIELRRHLKLQLRTLGVSPHFIGSDMACWDSNSSRFCVGDYYSNIHVMQTEKRKDFPKVLFSLNFLG